MAVNSENIDPLEKADLSKEASTMDELDQDMLYMRAKSSDLSALQKKYPQLPEAKLQQLQQLLQ